MGGGTGGGDCGAFARSNEAWRLVCMGLRAGHVPQQPHVASWPLSAALRLPLLLHALPHPTPPKAPPQTTLPPLPVLRLFGLVWFSLQPSPPAHTPPRTQAGLLLCLKVLVLPALQAACGLALGLPTPAVMALTLLALCPTVRGASGWGCVGERAMSRNGQRADTRAVSV